MPAIHSGQNMEARRTLGAADFLFSQFNPLIQETKVTGLQEGVAQHLCQGGRDREGESARDLISNNAVEGGDQRNIAFGNGFEKPIFFEKRGMLWMSDKRQVN